MLILQSTKKISTKQTTTPSKRHINTVKIDVTVVMVVQESLQHKKTSRSGVSIFFDYHNLTCLYTYHYKEISIKMYRFKVFIIVFLLGWYTSS